jgi:hypothetical protein
MRTDRLNHGIFTAREERCQPRLCGDGRGGYRFSGGLTREVSAREASPRSTASPAHP